MNQRWFYLIFITSFLIAGCAGGPQQKVGEVVEPQQQVDSLMQQGQYEEAARLLTDMASSAPAEEQAPLLLRAVTALARAENLVQAQQVLKRVNTSNLNEQQYFLYKLTLANIAIVERNPEAVLSSLMLAPPIDSSMAMKAEYHQLRAEAYTMQGHRLEAARERVFREVYLTDIDMIRKNQHAIWESLAQFSERALKQLRTEPAPNVFSGWMELVEIAKTYQLKPEVLKEKFAEWRLRYPSHPVMDEIVTNLENRSLEDVQMPESIALLLPLSSKFARAAEAIRDGFLAAYYSSDNRSTNRIRILDTGSTPENINSVYQQAIKDGARFVVGPLDKTAIQALAHSNTITVPTLSLNYGLDEDIPENLFQFGLSPEEEARQVAERTWLDGYVNAAVLVPEGPWGERVYQAFAERWQQVGGKIVEMQRYIATKNDFSDPIRKLMNIDDSQRRYRSLSLLLNRKIHFTARRRQDVDFVFLAAYPRQARQIRPQLKFFHASDVPVYATSHVYTGNLNQERDRDMDGLAFGDMPWVLSESTTHRNLRTKLDPYISKAGTKLQRLYALGIDTYNIIAALNTLKRYPYERFDGETGSLSLDSKQHIHRQLTWVKFRSGRPVLLDQGMQ